MTTIRLLILIGLTLALTGCSTTRVVLLPDADGKVGEVVVHTEKGQQKLDRARQSVTAGSFSAPSQPTVLSQAEVEKQFGQILRAEPLKPAFFVFMFRSDSTDLSEQSAFQIEKALTQIQQRDSCYIVSAGHTDAVGDRNYNIDLSLRRAQRVKNLLVERGIEAGCIETLSYGEDDPRVPTADNVAEPLNRRVELVVR